MEQAYCVSSPVSLGIRCQGGRREDDWTCPSCGNVNFSFMTTCNTQNCTQSRPADHNSESAANTVPLHQSFLSSAPNVGFGAPYSVYPYNYGSSLAGGIPCQPLGAPYSIYHYNYGSSIAGPSTYQSLVLSGPVPYWNYMLANDGMYCVPPVMGCYGYGLGLPMHPVPPVMDRYGYGLGFPMHPGMGLRPGFFPEYEPQEENKGEVGTRDDNWRCPQCGNINFPFRIVCNMCSTPKPRSQSGRSGNNAEQDLPEGSWKCEKCNNINYPFRNKCYRRNCGAYKPSSPINSPPEASGDDK